jgi:hypothetical protein
MMWFMAARGVLRRIGEPVVAAPPAGVRIRTRIHPTSDEADALAAVGAFLGSLYRTELANRVRRGALDRKRQADWRTERKQAITAASSSRWAGAITRAVEDQYQLGLRGLAAHVTDLRKAVGILEARCALCPNERRDIEVVPGRPTSLRGYASAAERFAKTRRLAALRARLAAAESSLSAGCPSIAVGGKRLWRKRNRFDSAMITESQWRDRWDAARMFLTADGESGIVGGNSTIRVDASGRLRIKTPAAIVNQLGSHLVIDKPVRFSHRGDEWAERIASHRPVRYDISFDPERGRWYLDASWKIPPTDVSSLLLGGGWGGRVLEESAQHAHGVAERLPIGGIKPLQIRVDGGTAVDTDLPQRLDALRGDADQHGPRIVRVDGA